jgi:nitrite reductase (NO-forming)
MNHQVRILIKKLSIGGYMKKKKLMLVSLTSIFLLVAVSSMLLNGCDKSYSSEVEGTENARLTYAPFVPPPITRNHATKVLIDLETKEVTRRLADGVEYTFWTFGGRVPGKFIRVRVGDLVEFRLHNSPMSKMPHNIDLHAVTGPGGGAASSFTAPGHTSTFSFKVINPGLYVYHCATAPVGMHIANGMYGLILVEPEEGLPPVDREFYVMQSEFYTEGKFGEFGVQPFSQQKAVDEDPSYVVFNGAVGSLVGENSLKAKKGETIRIYVGNGGPNLISSFHVIGEIFDKVYGEGGTLISQTDVQTTLVPAGGSAIVEFKVNVPGTFILVDHSIFRAFNKGALGMLQVSGEKDLVIYSGKQNDEVYFGSQDDDKSSSLQTDIKPLPDGKSNDIKDLIAVGKSIYTSTCAACHQLEGQGIPKVFPPLAKSDFLNKDKNAVISTVLGGKSGMVTVNNDNYNGVMPPQNLNDQEIASVLSYVYSQWGNSGKTVTAEEVKNIRSKINVAKK